MVKRQRVTLRDSFGNAIIGHVHLWCTKCQQAPQTPESDYCRYCLASELPLKTITRNDYNYLMSIDVIDFVEHPVGGGMIPVYRGNRLMVA